MTNALTIRLATVDDIPSLTRHRHQMFADMGVGSADSRQQMDEQYAVWVAPRIRSGEYLGWLACDGALVVAGAGLVLLDWLPNPFGDAAPRAYIANVYTEPDYRRRGLARRLMQTVLAYCDEQNLKHVRLHASDYGRPLYETLGFVATNEMELR